MGIGKQKKADSSSNALPTENTPLLFSSGHKPHALSTQLKIFANVFISIVGAGVLGLPYAFMRTGWLTSLLTILVVGALTYHGMMLLIRTRHKLRDSSYTIASFGDLGFAVSGSVGRFAVDFMIVLSEAGFCVGYLIFIADTLVNLFNSSSSSLLVGPKIWGVSTKTVYIWIVFPFNWV